MADDSDDDDLQGESTMVASRAELANAVAARAIARPFLLVAAARHNVGRTILVAGSLVVGRGDVDLPLDEDGLSRRHARFGVNAAGEVTVEDLKSTNGTFVNGERITRLTVLRDGDRIEVGTATILKLAFQDALQEGIQRRLYEEATRDGLTGAYNKRAFGEAFAKELSFALRHKRPLALIMFDGDHFKRVNDVHGHAGGDYVLRTLVELATSVLRVEDFLARWGGEEFAVVLRDVGSEFALVCAERLRASVERHPFVFEGRPIAVTISVGVVATVPAADCTAADLFERADKCLYAAKERGRNRVVGEPKY